MNKKIIIVICIVVVLICGVFVFMGLKPNNEKASSDNTQKAETSIASSTLDKEDVVNKLHFNYSSKATIKDSTNGKRIENENYYIIVSHQKEKTIDELENARKFSFISTDNINKVDWKKYSYNDEQVSSIVFMYEKDEGTYVITIAHDANSNINIDKEIEEFMNNVKFE